MVPFVGQFLAAILIVICLVRFVQCSRHCMICMYVWYVWYVCIYVMCMHTCMFLCMICMVPVCCSFGDMVPSRAEISIEQVSSFLSKCTLGFLRIEKENVLRWSNLRKQFPNQSALFEFVYTDVRGMRKIHFLLLSFTAS